MDINTMIAASMIGKQEEYDTQIVKDVWNNEMLGFTEEDFKGESNMCEAAYEAQGSEAFNKCRAAALACGSDESCNKLAVKYAAALVKGYSKDFESFKKKTSTLSAIGDIATGILSGIFGGKQGGGQGNIQVGGGAYYPPQEKSKNQRISSRKGAPIDFGEILQARCS